MQCRFSFSPLLTFNIFLFIVIPLPKPLECLKYFGHELRFNMRTLNLQTAFWDLVQYMMMVHACIRRWQQRRLRANLIIGVGYDGQSFFFDNSSGKD